MEHLNECLLSDEEHILQRPRFAVLDDTAGIIDTSKANSWLFLITKTRNK